MFDNAKVCWVGPLCTLTSANAMGSCGGRSSATAMSGCEWESDELDWTLVPDWSIVCVYPSRKQGSVAVGAAPGCPDQEIPGGNPPTSAHQTVQAQGVREGCPSSASVRCGGDFGCAPASRGETLAMLEILILGIPHPGLPRCAGGRTRRKRAGWWDLYRVFLIPVSHRSFRSLVIEIVYQTLLVRFVLLTDRITSVAEKGPRAL